MALPKPPHSRHRPSRSRIRPRRGSKATKPSVTTMTDPFEEPEGEALTELKTRMEERGATPIPTWLSKYD